MIHTCQSDESLSALYLKQKFHLFLGILNEQYDKIFNPQNSLTDHRFILICISNKQK